jgi:hypothetical protein
MLAARIGGPVFLIAMISLKVGPIISKRTLVVEGPIICILVQDSCFRYTIELKLNVQQFLLVQTSRRATTPPLYYNDCRDKHVANVVPEVNAHDDCSLCLEEPEVEYIADPRSSVPNLMRPLLVL